MVWEENKWRRIRPSLRSSPYLTNETSSCARINAPSASSAITAKLCAASSPTDGKERPRNCWQKIMMDSKRGCGGENSRTDLKLQGRH
ncbi:hypothetical protein DPMN_094214 [Dreissena polymorpha]|uniref:Uncharacterized protein n=1 Tax=Dreissena polymorpha TaxID=45954 RepID=A0A9D4R3C3_DREPO|nr:hypothetical protein DPMN_094214 [Dreissena polymorpha]